MSRSAAAVITALAVAASAACPAAIAAKIPAGSHLVDEAIFDPNASDKDNNWHSKILDPDLEYTVIVSGTITEPTNTTKGPSVRTRDALYCSDPQTADIDCGGSPRRSPTLLFNAGPTGKTTAYDGIDTLAGNRGQIPVQGDHEYDARFEFKLVANAPDDYRLYANSTLYYCPACGGAINLKVYGPESAAHGTVDVTFLQRGLPKSHTEDLQRSGTSGRGTLRLTEEPEDRDGYATAPLLPKGGMTILHSDNFVTADDTAVILGVVKGTYAVRPGTGEDLHLIVEVVTSSDPDCEEGRRGFVNIFEPAARSHRSPQVVTNLCADHKHTFKRFKSGGTVRAKIVRHRAPSRARLL